jgi:hypothetical protein
VTPSGANRRHTTPTGADGVPDIEVAHLPAERHLVGSTLDNTIVRVYVLDTHLFHPSVSLTAFA